MLARRSVNDDTVSHYRVLITNSSEQPPLLRCSLRGSITVRLILYSECVGAFFAVGGDPDGTDPAEPSSARA